MGELQNSVFKKLFEYQAITVLIQLNALEALHFTEKWSIRAYSKVN